VTVQRFAARLVFPIEAIECASFRAVYEQWLPFGDEAIDSRLGEVTFLHPAARDGRFDSLERLLVDAGLPYNLYSGTQEEGEWLHYWRPGMRASERTDPWAAATLNNSKFTLSIRRACEELVYGQAGLALGR
jgi:hypothetical protein